MTRFLALALMLALPACSGFKGSPHGYAVVGSGSTTGIAIGMDPANGLPSITLGTREGRFAAWPTLDGDGKPFDPTAILACFETEAGTGASVMSVIATGNAAELGCPK